MIAGKRLRAERVSRKYRKWRRRILNEEPLCRTCARNGFTVAAAEIDHIVPVAKAPDQFWNTDAVQPTCRACHEAKTNAENRRESPEQVAWRERVKRLS